MMAIPSRDAADALMTKLQLLLNDQTTCSWHEVLATAIALRHATALVSGAAEMRRALDVEVISKAYVETGRRGEAISVLVDALAAASSETSGRVEAQAQRQISYELHIRQLLQRCYQACFVIAPNCSSLTSQNSLQPPCSTHSISAAGAATAAASSQQHHSCNPQQEQPGHGCSYLQQGQSQTMWHQQRSDHAAQEQQQQQQQQQYFNDSIANCRRMQQLAATLHDHHKLALISADMAEQYIAFGKASNACQCYHMCLEACTAAATAAAAATSGSPASNSSGIQEVLVQVVPAAVDAHLLQGDLEGARAVLTAYNTLLQPLGRSAYGECAVCYEQLTGSTPVTLLACGHIFHRQCCNEWFGHKLFEAGQFHPACPLCRQVDRDIKPSEAALRALEDIQHYCPENSSVEATSDDSASHATGSEAQLDGDGADGVASVRDAAPHVTHGELQLHVSIMPRWLNEAHQDHHRSTGIIRSEGSDIDSDGSMETEEGESQHESERESGVGSNSDNDSENDIEDDSDSDLQQLMDMDNEHDACAARVHLQQCGPVQLQEEQQLRMLPH